ncbi:hypothetical protein Ato02nite_019240 [Paractinoplanes toevensis]|uniref:Uncharacterized protein n=1 Tax=Paractinoplanes toevensis TaxID=571911 RepID=A0A919T9P7_9ACTN|nr:hypothetical protein Ato02nite_019240 [Actinoplanes toevensis]
MTQNRASLLAVAPMCRSSWRVLSSTCVDSSSGTQTIMVRIVGSGRCTGAAVAGADAAVGVFAPVRRVVVGFLLSLLGGLVLPLRDVVMVVASWVVGAVGRAEMAGPLGAGVG